MNNMKESSCERLRASYMYIRAKAVFVIGLFPLFIGVFGMYFVWNDDNNIGFFITLTLLGFVISSSAMFKIHQMNKGCKHGKIYRATYIDTSVILYQKAASIQLEYEDETGQVKRIYSEELRAIDDINSMKHPFYDILIMPNYDRAIIIESFDSNASESHS